MEHLLKRTFNLRQTELWAATVLYVFAVFFLVSRGGSSIGGRNGDPYLFADAHVHYSFLSNFFIPKLIRYTLLYGAFMVLNFRLTPIILSKEGKIWPIVSVIALFALMGLAFAITDTWLKAYQIAMYDNDLQEFYNNAFKNNFIFSLWLLMMYCFYTVVKLSAGYILQNSDKIEAKYQLVSRECALAIVVWMIIFLLMLGSNAPGELLACCAFILPIGIVIYWYSFYELIPSSMTSKKKFGRYLWRVFTLVLLSVLPISLVVLIIFNDAETWLMINLFNLGSQLLITAPLTWQVYKRRKDATAELLQLKSALGNSTAGLDFLRSQINPHFLFNSLNTLYGTALQENGERTANGIQKLGDMMRFMLHENHQDTILLGREMEYLRNYIELQLLRTEQSPDIRVEVNMEDTVSDKRIAPMLLIPFIENAFKHGISLAKPSWINMTLFSNDRELYFDVYNSIHPRNGDDPERDKSGIGLENVKQRLQLLYPDRHKLIIRETAKEFFVHLTIEL